MNTPDLRDVIRQLESVAGDTAGLEARWLAEHAKGHGLALAALVQRRLNGEPVDRIIGWRGFWTQELIVTPDTLSPRPDSETIVEAARDALLLRRDQRAPLTILDLGTGTGALLLALLSLFPGAAGTGIDTSAAALDVAIRNADRNGLSARAAFLRGDWTSGLAGAFDLVVSNPPYISSADIAELDREVRLHDPWLALDGGADGLDAYRAILPRLPDLLWPDGVAVLEIGIGQADDVSRLATQAGLDVIDIRPDLSGIPRAVILSRMLPNS